MTEECDVIVLGTGAAGLTAALAAAHSGASVKIYEKSSLVGGTSAMSGGIIWMPNNHLQEITGTEDSREKALAYLESLSLGQIDSDMAATFVDKGPEMLQWVEKMTPCSFHIIDSYPDYHPEHPGGLPEGGRSIDNDLFALPRLGDWATRIRNHEQASPVMLTETPLGGSTTFPDMDVIGERLQAGEIGMGLALVAGLLRGLLDMGIEPQIRSQAVKLTGGTEGISGVTIEQDGETVDVTAKRGVIIATGGFEWNAELVRTFLRGPMTAPAGSPDSTGDGLRMAMEVGAKLGNMRNAWWVPVARVPNEELFGHPSVRLILLERTRPHSFMVNKYGKRFTNEAGNYNAMGGAFHSFDPQKFEYPNEPCWLIFDHEHKLRYEVAGCPAGEQIPEWIYCDDSIEGLASQIGIEGSTLRATLNHFNNHAVDGNDPDFRRGESAYDTFNGDQSLDGVQATLQPLDTSPFYAVKIESGALGTNGGPKTDVSCRVLSLAGGVIPGLYAAGNAMAAPTGMVYGGAGGTLGPAMTFGYIAGIAAANR
ncbi:MAG TPA: FAD-dependent oxidoreductase [Acidimicrobiales bacterium]|nr:FAD-dependent oxidoreductase [Acidimicrobiales bacterium]